MAFSNMYAEIRGAIPKMPLPFCKTLINRAYKDLRRQNLWSFQLYDKQQWIAPPQINSGTVNVTQGSATVVFDATAAAAINLALTTSTWSLIAQRQFRVAAGTVYNITAWDGSSNMTLDRIYGEATDADAQYQIYQVYYAAPYQDHLTFTSIRDMQNFIDLSLTKTREMLDQIDPQRSWYTFPTDAVAYMIDQNSASPTYGYPLYELWGAPVYSLNYQLYGIRKGVDLALDSDTLPMALGEDAVIELAKVYAYEWAEANKGSEPRNQGPDFKFLMGKCSARYKQLYQEYRRQDRETINNWFSIRRSPWGAKWIPYYSVQSGAASPGAGFMW